MSSGDGPGVRSVHPDKLKAAWSADLAHDQCRSAIEAAEVDMMMAVVVSVVMVLVEGRIESGGRVRRADELHALRERYELE